MHRYNEIIVASRLNGPASAVSHHVPVLHYTHAASVSVRDAPHVPVQASAVCACVRYAQEISVKIRFSWIVFGGGVRKKKKKRQGRVPAHNISHCILEGGFWTAGGSLERDRPRQLCTPGWKCRERRECIQWTNPRSRVDRRRVDLSNKSIFFR